MFRRLLETFATIAVLMPVAVAAQSAHGGVILLVRDSSGAAIPGASIRITSQATGEPIDGVTDAQGVYQARALAPGRYSILAALDGFEPIVRETEIAPKQTAAFEVTLSPSRLTESVVVTARRVEEIAQEVPIPLSVITGQLVADAGAFNVNRLKELIPTVQFYSSNPRNTSINIRGLGAPFGLTNDGIEPGVGMYIDGTFFARPGAATLDFLDVERIEVLRGPQGTLFGKNATAGAINVTTRKPTFRRESDFELSVGSLGLLQAKGSVSGPLRDNVAGRLSFSGTLSEGSIRHTQTGLDLNGHNNLGLRGQVLFAPSDRLGLTVSVDHTRQRPDGHAQVVAGVAPTQRSANRQYPQIAADLGYTPPSFNAFDRLTDTDTPWRSYQDVGGASATLERTIGAGRLTSITAWRYWRWRPSNDRDFIGLPVTTISANPSDQRQLTQEVRYAGVINPSLNFVVGAFGFRQTIDSTGKQEQGAAAARFLLAPSAAGATRGLLDGYGQVSDIHSTNVSAALFGQVEWSMGDRLRVLPGLRFNYDQKSVDYDTQIYGGLQTTNPALVALQRSILAPQAYQADVDDTNMSGQLTVAYQVAPRANAFATYATSFKSVGLNLAGVPTNAAGEPVLEAATVKPEEERHVEIGFKTEPFAGGTVNLTLFNTDIDDYQAQVVNASVGVLRGYLANAEKVRVRGVELDGTARVGRTLSIHGAAAYTDGKYIAFRDAPAPLEDTGGPQAKDISGSVLPGISEWAFSVGGEYATRASRFAQAGEVFAGADASYRSSFSSSATASRYLMVDGYGLLNARLGYRWADGWSISLWTRNLLNNNYYELLSAAPGGSGLYVGLPGEPRTVGVTLRVAVRPRN